MLIGRLSPLIDFSKVMDAQTDLVETLAQFDPKIVKMANGGKAED